MDVSREFLHMLDTKASASSQVVLEEDVNLSEQLPDISAIYLSKGNITVEELQPGEDEVLLRGYLRYRILYYTGEDSGRLECLEGRFPLEEKIYLQGVTRQDEIQQCCQIEDTNVLMINSRKLSLRFAVTFTVIAHQIKDAQVITGITEGDCIQTKWEEIEAASLLCCRQEVLKLRKELPVDKGNPGIEKLLWCDISFLEAQERCEENQIRIQGRLLIRGIYQGEDTGNGSSVVPFEESFTVSREIECTGCKMGMIPYCIYNLENESLHVLPDQDGDPKILLAEGTLCISLKVYEICNYNRICQAYGTKKNLVMKYKTEEIPRIMRKITGKQKIEKRVTTTEGAGADFFQLLTYSGELYPLGMEKKEQGLVVRGFLEVCIMMVVGEDDNPFAQEKVSVPYEYMLETGAMNEACTPTVQSALDGLSVVATQNGVLEIQAIASFDVVVTELQKREQIMEITEEEIAPEILDALPDMLILRVEEGQDIWSIGQKYYMTVQEICDQNNLENPVVTKGQKLILMRG